MSCFLKRFQKLSGSSGAKWEIKKMTFFHKKSGFSNLSYIFNSTRIIYKNMFRKVMPNKVSEISTLPWGSFSGLKITFFTKRLVSKTSTFCRNQVSDFLTQGLVSKKKWLFLGGGQTNMVAKTPIIIYEVAMSTLGIW